MFIIKLIFDIINIKSGHFSCVEDTQFSCQDGSWSKINGNWVIWARGLMLQDPKPPVNPKETSLMTHPDASMILYNISKTTKNNMWI